MKKQQTNKFIIINYDEKRGEIKFTKKLKDLIKKLLIASLMSILHFFSQSTDDADAASAEWMDGRKFQVLMMSTNSLSTIRFENLFWKKFKFMISENETEILWQASFNNSR